MPKSIEGLELKSAGLKLKSTGLDKVGGIGDNISTARANNDYFHGIDYAYCRAHHKFGTFPLG